MVALRYLRARRKEGFISVIAGFSFLGIMLGVATLIIVMAVMNGFRRSCQQDPRPERPCRSCTAGRADFTDYDDVVAERISGVPGVKYALPLSRGR